MTETLSTNSTADQSVNCLKWVDEYLAGVMYQERSLVVLQLKLREQIWLKREPNHPQDANAIVAERQCGSQIGYVRRELAAYLTPYMDQAAQRVEATITELSSDATGSSYRVRVRFCVPSDWLKPQADADGKADRQSIEYYYDDSGINTYVLLNCSEESFSQIREKLAADDIQFRRYGLCYRPASNGLQYQWYVRIDKTPDLSRQTIEEFFKRRFNLTPDALEDEKLRLESEILDLQASLSKSRQEAEDYEDLAVEIDSESILAKQKLSQRIEQLQSEVIARECEIQRLEDEKRRSKYENENSKTSEVSNNVGDSLYDIPDHVAEVFTKVTGKTLTPSQSLEVIGKLFPNRIEILPTAWKSARESKSFKHRKELLELLWNLATEYWGALASGRSDADARSVFGEHYAATESESVEKNRRARLRRTFAYNGRKIEMMKHLKIGAKHSDAETIRVHFEWDAGERKILIGHCGRHLYQK